MSRYRRVCIPTAPSSAVFGSASTRNRKQGVQRGSHLVLGLDKRGFRDHHTLRRWLTNDPVRVSRDGLEIRHTHVHNPARGPLCGFEAHHNHGRDVATYLAVTASTRFGKQPQSGKRLTRWPSRLRGPSGHLNHNLRGGISTRAGQGKVADDTLLWC